MSLRRRVDGAVPEARFSAFTLFVPQWMMVIDYLHH